MQAPRRRPALSLRPLYDAVIGDPIAGGRLRLAGTPPVERSLAVLGLVALAGLLLSLLAGDAWRGGRLVFLSYLAGRASFIPEALIPVTLLAFALAWILFLWGATLASLEVRIGAALLFLLVTATIGEAPAVAVGSSLALRYGPLLARICYVAVPVLMAVSSTVGRRERWARRLRYPVLAGIVLAVGGMFAVQLFIYAAQTREGLPVYGPDILENAISSVQNLILPLIFAAGLAVIQFSYGVAEAAAAPAWSLAAPVARLGVGALLAVKLTIQLFPLQEWADYLRARPVAALRVLASLAVVGLVAAVARRIRIDRSASSGSSEKLVYVGAFTLAAPLLLNLLAVQAISFLLSQFGLIGVSGLIDGWPYQGIIQYGWLGLWTAGLGLSWWLLRSDSPSRRELGLGILLFSLWNLASTIFVIFDLRPGFKDAFLDLVVTLLIAAFLLLRWRRIDAGGAVRLGALAIFSWLVLTRADFVSIIGSLAGAPGVLVVVVGVIFTLLADSAFASGHSRRFPRPARILLWIGFLLLSVTILNWVQATHVTDEAASQTDFAFFLLGLPLAAWLAMRRPFEPGRS